MQMLVDKFRELPDYRKCKQIKYNVGELLFLSLLATVSGANGYKDIAIWIKSKKQELRSFLGKPFIVPATNTIRNVFLNIDTEALDNLFKEWSQSSLKSKTLNIVAADGKTMRGSGNKIREEKARHIVSLFATKEKITLAQKEVDDKSNEIPALLELLDSLELENCIITVDAMHTQKNTEQDLKKAA
jgi:hypothetical protein